MSNQKLELSDNPTTTKHHHKASSVSESQEEGTITEGRYPNGGDGTLFVGNGDFGEIERDDINVEGIKPKFWANPSKSACITVYFFTSCDWRVSRITERAVAYQSSLFWHVTREARRRRGEWKWFQLEQLSTWYVWRSQGGWPPIEAFGCHLEGSIGRGNTENRTLLATCATNVTIFVAIRV